MRWFERIAQRQMDAAAARGELSGLKGEGQPLDPVRLRESADDVLHRMMADAGFIPPELAYQKEAEAKRAVLAQLEDEEERKAMQKQIALLELKRAMSADARRKSMRG